MFGVAGGLPLLLVGARLLGIAQMRHRDADEKAIFLRRELAALAALNILVLIFDRPPGAITGPALSGFGSGWRRIRFEVVYGDGLLRARASRCGLRGAAWHGTSRCSRDTGNRILGNENGKPLSGWKSLTRDAEWPR